VDGARLANAAAALGVPLRAITSDAGVDLLSLGGTKNGAIGAEAVVFFREEPARRFGFIRKQGMQLASKMRFVSAQFEALLTDELWLRSARHANAMARRLADGVCGVPGVTITQPVEANAVFAILPPERIAPLQEKWFFHVWDDRRHEVRWMTAWDTTEEDVDGFVKAVRSMAL
jgi:threonine aldolase